MQRDPIHWIPRSPVDRAAQDVPVDRLRSGLAALARDDKFPAPGDPGRGGVTGWETDMRDLLPVTEGLRCANMFFSGVNGSY